MLTPDTNRTRIGLNLTITVGDEILTGTLNDSAAGQDFSRLLPLTLTLSDYHQTEKVSDLPRKLSVDNAPAGYKPSVGDIAYYAPWGNLAIFYRDFSYAAGLIHLGSIDSGIGILAQGQPFVVTIKLNR